MTELNRELLLGERFEKAEKAKFKYSQQKQQYFALNKNRQANYQSEEESEPESDYSSDE